MKDAALVFTSIILHLHHNNLLALHVHFLSLIFVFQRIGKYLMSVVQKNDFLWIRERDYAISYVEDVQ